MRCLALLLLAGLALAQEDEGAGGEKEAEEGGLGALAGGLDWKAKPIDFKRVDRTIKKLPELKSEKPLYGLFLFGVEGKTRVWAVLDASAKGKTEYDVLYLDRNADGDLTGKDERFESNDIGQFRIGDFREPGTDVVHKDFEIVRSRNFGVFHYEMAWAGGPVVDGPYGPSVSKGTDLGASPAEAPAFVLSTERPFEFEQSMNVPLKRGQENDFHIRIGNRGDRPGAFTGVDQSFLPEGERVLIQLICKDAAGVERKLTAELKERSPSRTYHGPLELPSDAKPGPAIMRVRLPESSEYESFTTDIPVTIE